MAHRAIRRIVAAGAATAFALGTLGLLGAGTANADSRTVDWGDGWTHFWRTIDNETPAVGETITITTRFERGSEQEIWWVKDHHPTCLTYVDGTATMNGDHLEPNLEIKPDFIAGDFNAAGSPVIIRGDKEQPATFVAQYRVGENCPRNVPLQTGMSFSSKGWGVGTYLNRGPTLTVSKGSTNTTLNPITGATVGKNTVLIANVTPAAAGGTVTFKEDNRIISTAYVGSDGTATAQWAPATAGQRTITADFSGRGDTVGSRATATVTVAPAGGNATASTTTLNPITGATANKATTLKAKVNPAAAGGTVEFKDGDTVLGTAQVGANGEATHQWTPTTEGQRTITATFSGRNGVTGSTTTQQVTVAKAGTTPGGAGSLDSLLGGFGS
ncbi:Ig-like domain-containing protein [Rhodococcus maanshanensis]|uniref:Ig-like domain (Group 3) n=2 Tax=Rhodococcus maanshanensis TaxID=183556 RepID=A0A1H7J7D8_9NOCA|nr:Ig-like domain-containing protein [Rhodococcus maanshanensis]SEK70274.1 Ig-like domain (group 3) [Rhodococcus maanshanensis]